MCHCFSHFLWLFWTDSFFIFCKFQFCFAHYCSGSSLHHKELLKKNVFPNAMQVLQIKHENCTSTWTYFFKLQNTTPVLGTRNQVLLCFHSTTSTTVYDSTLLQFYSVLQRSAWLRCPSVYFFELQSTTLQYHTVLQRTTPVQFYTSKNNSRTTLNYKVLP